MSAGSLRERVAEALDLHTVLTGVRDLRKRCTCGWTSEERQGLTAHRAHLADAVLAEVGAWLASNEAREVVAAEIACGVDYPAGTAYDALEALAALIDQTKED